MIIAAINGRNVCFGFVKRLRAEMADLGGDEDDDEFDENTDDAKRSMKILLKCGQIPDASMIHELKKKRQQARQGDYIPIDDVNRLEDTKSRMIRYFTISSFELKPIRL